MPDFPPYLTLEEWRRAGYLFRESRCSRKGCGLPTVEFYLPNDRPYRVDPLTRRPHDEVCGNEARVRAMIAEEDSRDRRSDLDWKQKQSGER